MREKIINSIKLLVVVLIGFGVGGGVTYYLLEDKLELTTTIIENKSETTGIVKCSSDITINENSISVAVGKIYDATVTLQNYQRNTLILSGSGFIYKKEGKYAYILTNYHVVEGTDNLIVTLSSDDQVEGEVLGGDNYLDLAVVRIDSDNVKQVATIGNSENSNLGDTVFTVGSPVGYGYRGSVSKGTLSGKNRMVTVSVNATSDWIMNVLQIDAAINPGNSGGPLLNVNGEVIGINSLKLVEDEIEGMGFAIPIEYAMKYVDRFEKGEAIERPLIGINMVNATDKYGLYQYNIVLNKEIEEGIVVIGVSSDSAADKAGIEKGDVIIAINGKKVADAANLKYELYQYEIGDTITITYLRNNNEETVKLTLTKAEN